MKIKAKVVAAENSGKSISIRMQGSVAARNLWGTSIFLLQIADTSRNRKTFCLGRNVELTVVPK
jgi:hypothetical protein